jgi:hypothetical protein
VSYALSRPAMAPTGRYYEVAASPRGDLLIWQSETGIASWVTAWIGVFGIVSFFVNLVVYKREWRVVVREFHASRSSDPASNVLLSRDVPKNRAEATMEQLASQIEKGELDPETPA